MKLLKAGLSGFTFGIIVVLMGMLFVRVVDARVAVWIGQGIALSGAQRFAMGMAVLLRTYGVFLTPLFVIACTVGGVVVAAFYFAVARRQ